MALMPLDPNNPLFRILNPGMPSGGGAGGVGGLFGRGPSWIGQGAQFGQQSGIRGLLSDPNLGLALLANSGYGPKRSFGEILGTSALQAKQMRQESEDAEFKRRYMEAQMGAMQRRGQEGQFGAVDPDQFTPDSLARFQKSGDYGDLTPKPRQLGLGNVNPGDYTPESLAVYLKSGNANDLKRYVAPAQPSVQVVNGVPTVVTPDRTGITPPRVNPLSTLETEADAAARLAREKAAGAAVGTGAGTTLADINTKASDAQTMLDTIKKADGIINKATGSWIGNVIDKGAGAFGKSTEGAKAGASLKVLQAGLLSFVPKMSGPQSDADRLIYIEAVGQIGDATSPRETRKAALRTVEDMQKQYIERASQPFKPTIYMPGSPESNKAKVDEFNKYLDKYAPRK